MDTSNQNNDTLNAPVLQIPVYLAHYDEKVCSKEHLPVAQLVEKTSTHAYLVMEVIDSETTTAISSSRISTSIQELLERACNILENQERQDALQRARNHAERARRESQEALERVRIYTERARRETQDALQRARNHEERVRREAQAIRERVIQETQSSLSNRLRNANTPLPSPSPSGWSCGNCTFHNSSINSSICETCEYERDYQLRSHPLPSPTPSQPSTTVQESEHINLWKEAIQRSKRAMARNLVDTHPLTPDECNHLISYLDEINARTPRNITRPYIRELLIQMRDRDI